MKKMFAKLGMPALLSLAFLLGGLLFGANCAYAQTTTTGPQSNGPIKTLGTWRNSTDATASLESQIIALNQMLNAGQGNPNPLKVKLLIYQGIIVSLDEGMAVPDAAMFNYNKYKPGFHSSADVLPTLPNSDWQTIYSDMISALQL